MAIRKKNVSESVRPDMMNTAITFHDVVDGVEAFENLDEAASWFSLHGMEIVSPRARSTDSDYKPVSSIEKAFSRVGIVSMDGSFTVEKDGYQTEVFEREGEMVCSNWVLDRESGKMEFLQMPDQWEKLMKDSEKARHYAVPSDEVITGTYARLFVNETRWSQALDFKVEGWPEFVGLRYKDFGTSRAVHAKLEDGSTISLNSPLGIRRTGELLEGLAVFLKEQRKQERMDTKTLSESGPLTKEQMEYVFRPFVMTDVPSRSADILRLHGMRNLADVLALGERGLDTLFAGNIKHKAWLMDCLERHGLQDKFGLKMDSRSNTSVRNVDYRPDTPSKSSKKSKRNGVSF